MSKRSIRISGHPTSLSLEDSFWDALAEIATKRGMSVAALVAEIDAARADDLDGSLSSALRVYILDWYRQPR